MSENELKPKLEKLGLRQKDFAQLLDVSTRTVNLWATGAQPLPGSVAGYLRLLEVAEPATRELEFARLCDRSPPLRSGIYAVTFHTASGFCGHARVALNGGRISGAVDDGLCLDGTYVHDRRRGRNLASVRVGASPSDEEVLTIELTGSGGDYSAKVDIERETYEIDVRFLGPLPD